MRKLTFLLEIKFEEKTRALLDLLNALTEKLDELCASEKAFDYQLKITVDTDYIDFYISLPKKEARKFWEKARELLDSYMQEEENEP